MRLFRPRLLLLMLAITLRAASAQTASTSAPASMPPDMPMSMPMSMPMPAASAPASTLPAATDVTVTLSTDVEDGKKQLIATVKRAGKPVENAIVSFGATRTFGRLVLGADTTLDDGTAAIPFPADLPGDAAGNIEFNAMVQGPLSQWGAATTATLAGGAPRQPPADSFPRALWSPSAPLGLIAAIVILVGGAWGAYLFVFYQLMAIRRGASR